MASAGAYGVRVYGGLIWCPRFDEFRKQKRIEMGVVCLGLVLNLIECVISRSNGRANENEGLLARLEIRVNC